MMPVIADLEKLFICLLRQVYKPSGYDLRRLEALCADVAAVADSNYLFAMGHEELVMVIPVFGALVIGGLIGFERTFHGRPAGFRTHSLVCVASALLMLVAPRAPKTMSTTPRSARVGPALISCRTA
jgi:hypothetical protein